VLELNVKQLPSLKIEIDEIVCTKDFVVEGACLNKF